MVKRLTFVLTLGTAALLVAAAGAWACTNLASLNAARATVLPGESVTIMGTSFSAMEEGVTPVAIRWNGADGEILAEVEPDSSGSFSASVTIPSDAPVGQYVLVATQLSGEPGHGLEAAEDLAPIFGTPARAPLMVGNPAEAAPADAGVQPVAAAPEPSSGGLLLLSGLLALSALGLFAGAAIMLGRDVGQRRAGTPVPVEDRGSGRNS